MSASLDILTVVAVTAGAFFFLAGTVGLLRFPDTLSRLHALTKADNLGLGLLVLGLLPQAAGPLAGLKLVVIWLLVLVAGSDGRPADRAGGAGRQATAVTATLALDVALAVLILALASWITLVKDAFAAVVGYLVYGLLLALVWVRLAAVDVAMTEAAIGGGVTGVLLLGAVARLPGAGAAGEPTGPAQRVAAAILSLLVTGGIAAGVLMLPDPAPTLAPLAAGGLPATGVGNPVTATLMAYRAVDTMLEKVVLVLALLGVWSLAPDRFWGGRPGLRYPLDRDGVLAFLARLLIPVGILVGTYVLWVSADEPGGAFQGGTILAAMWILAMMAGLTEAPPVSGRRLRLVLVVGAAVFVAVGLAGFAMAGAFLAYPPAFAKPLILAIEVPATLSVAAALGMLTAGPPERTPER